VCVVFLCFCFCLCVCLCGESDGGILRLGLGVVEFAVPLLALGSQRGPPFAFCVQVQKSQYADKEEFLCPCLLVAVCDEGGRLGSSRCSVSQLFVSLMSPHHLGLGLV